MFLCATFVTQNFSFTKKNKNQTNTVPPRWIVEPTDVNVERNRHITLHCQAQGVPMPVIVWKKAAGKFRFIASLNVLV